MNSTTKNTLIESGKIVAKIIAGFIAIMAVWYVLTQVYVVMGFESFKSEFFAWVTLCIPVIVYGFAMVVWSEAKHRVWKRENNIE